MRQVILDTETTGLNPATGDRVIEIGCVELVNRRLTDTERPFTITLIQSATSMRAPMLSMASRGLFYRISPSSHRSRKI